MVALSLNVLIGMGGQISIGHAGFWALGAYASALAVSKLGLPFVLARAGGRGRGGVRRARGTAGAAGAGALSRDCDTRLRAVRTAGAVRVGKPDRRTAGPLRAAPIAVRVRAAERLSPTTTCYSQSSCCSPGLPAIFAKSHHRTFADGAAHERGRGGMLRHRAADPHHHRIRDQRVLHRRLGRALRAPARGISHRDLLARRVPLLPDHGGDWRAAFARPAPCLAGRFSRSRRRFCASSRTRRW